MASPPGRAAPPRPTALVIAASSSSASSPSPSSAASTCWALSQRIVDEPVPARRRSRPRARRSATCTHRLPHRGRDLLPRRGPDRLERPPLPAQPGDDDLPPQTHGNNLAEVVWTVVPTIIVLFLFVISWQTLNTVEAVSRPAGPQDPRRRRPVPVAVRVPPDDGTADGAAALHRSRPRPARDGGHGRPGRPDVHLT